MEVATNPDCGIDQQLTRGEKTVITRISVAPLQGKHMSNGLMTGK
jgi:hypothetical protein